MAEPIRRIEKGAADGPEVAGAQAAALEEALGVLSALHESGMLQGLRALVEGSGAIAERLLEQTEASGAARALQNLLVLSAALQSVEPGKLRRALSDLSAAGEAMERTFGRGNGAGVLALMRLLRGREVQLALSSLGALLGDLGRGRVGTSP